MVAVPALALAACLAFELAATVAVVVEDPLASYADDGFRVVVQWPRLVAFAAALLLDVLLLVVGAVRIARHPAAPVGEGGYRPARVADWTVRVTAVFPVVALAYLVAWAALGGNPTGIPYPTAGLQAAVGAVALAIAVLSLVLLAPALRLLRRGPFRTGRPAAVGAVALAVVTVGVPFAATWLDPPAGTSPESAGFAELVPAPSPRLDGVIALACGRPSRCVAIGMIRGLEYQIRYGLATTADGGRTWHTALLPENVTPGGSPACMGAECWDPMTSYGKVHRRLLASISVGAAGRSTVHLHRAGLAPVGAAGMTCWSASRCLGLTDEARVLRGSPPRSADPPVAIVTTDGGTHWTTVQLPLPAGLSAPSLTTQGPLQGPWCTAEGTCLAGVQAVPSGCPPAARPSATCPLRLVMLRTTDGGATWQSWDPLPGGPRPTVLLCTAPPECLANDSASRSHQTYVLSSDTGETWGPARPFGRHVDHIACSPERCIRRVALRGTRSQLEISTDGGRSWRSGPVSVGSSGIAECTVTGRCLATFTAGLGSAVGPTGSAMFAVSGPGGHWLIRTLPAP